MALLIEVIQQMKLEFRREGFTVYDQDEWYKTNKKLTELPGGQFPVIFISEGLETRNEETPIHIMSEEANININVTLNTGAFRHVSDSAIVLRRIKNIINQNRNNCFWYDWNYSDSFDAVLKSANRDTDVYGGRNINSLVNYRESAEINCIEEAWSNEGELLFNESEVVYECPANPAIEYFQWFNDGEVLFNENEIVVGRL